jgi:hypothetical protein
MAALTDRQRDLLQHIARYRVTTVEAVDRLLYVGKSGKSSPVAALNLLRRLVDGDYLAAPYRILGRNYYHLSAHGARYVGVSRRAVIDTPAVLRERYTLLAFCVLQPQLRRYLPPDEFAKGYPEIAKQEGIDPSHQHFFQTRHAGKQVLGQALIDIAADPPRVVRKLRETMLRIVQTPGLAELADSFLLTVLTSEPSKAQKITQLLEQLVSREPMPLPLRPSIVVVEQMRHLPDGSFALSRADGAAS